LVYVLNSVTKFAPDEVFSTGTRNYPLKTLYIKLHRQEDPPLNNYRWGKHSEWNLSSGTSLV